MCIAVRESHLEVLLRFFVLFCFLIGAWSPSLILSVTLSKVKRGGKVFNHTCVCDESEIRK